MLKLEGSDVGDESGVTRGREAEDYPQQSISSAPEEVGVVVEGISGSSTGREGTMNSGKL